MIHLRDIIVLPLLVGSAACDSAQTTDFVAEPEPVALECLPRPVGEHLVPLATGNTWITETFTRQGLNSVTTEVARDTLNWPGWEGAAFAIDRHVVQLGVEFAIDYSYVHGNDGLGFSYLGGLAGSDSVFVRWDTNPYPAVLGQESQFVSFSYLSSGRWAHADSVLIRKVVTLDTLITTPAGSFHAIGYQMDSRPRSDPEYFFRSIEYFAPGVGRVYTESQGSTDTELRRFSRLTEYCLMQEPSP